METTHIKVFSANSLIIVRGLENRLKENSINSLIKDHVSSGQIAGFGALGNSVELFVLNTDLEKATPLIERYKKEINS